MNNGNTGLLVQLFQEARTFSAWQARPVPEAAIEAAFALARLGPTSANCQPLRLVLVKSPEAKAKLLACVSTGNYPRLKPRR
jgi:3-hydroxypropanoate dehydrogenase